ncbi:transcriptional repressor [Micromonospora sp. NPDC049274]|uniref:Fur family transcriptional regulator n=1 Tax=Micromonospora sp. NPDC049274 TaxID=3154829 RepID=UPI0034426B21
MLLPLSCNKGPIVVRGTGLITETSDRLAPALGRLRQQGLRLTLARRAVLTALVNTPPDKPHLSAAQVHERVCANGLPVDLTTVHRVLIHLTELGELHTVPVGGAMTYGFADHPHHHAVCTLCERVRQLPPDAALTAVQAADAVGFTADLEGRSGGVVVYGRCTSC